MHPFELVIIPIVTTYMGICIMNDLHNQRLIIKGMCVTIDMVKISIFMKGVSSVSAL